MSGQELSIIKPVEEARIITLEPKVYSIIRSFVESSEKPEYVWNKGIKVGEKIVFTKPGKWVLEVFTQPPQDGPFEPFIVCLEPAGIGVTVRGNLIIYDVEGDAVRVPVSDIEALLKTYVTANVPFAIPISLWDILKKIRTYVEI